MTSAAAKAKAATASHVTRMLLQAAAAPRSEAGRYAVQIAARPEPTAIAGAPKPAHSSTAHSTTRAPEAPVAGTVASDRVTRATAT